MDGVRQLERGAWSLAPPSSQKRWSAALSAWHPEHFMPEPQVSSDV
jgi:hypothetical protein